MGGRGREWREGVERGKGVQSKEHYIFVFDACPKIEDFPKNYLLERTLRYPT